MQVKVDHIMILSLKLGEEELTFPVPDPIHVYQLGEIVKLNIMRPESKDNKFEIVKAVVKDIEHEVVDFGEAEQLVRVKLEKVE